MGRKQRNIYRQTILALAEDQLYTQAALADLCVAKGLLDITKRPNAKAAFRRFTKNTEADAFVKIPGHGGQFPAWYGRTLKALLNE